VKEKEKERKKERKREKEREKEKGWCDEEHLYNQSN